MSGATILQLPGTVPALVDQPGINLTPEEVKAAAGGYVRGADQLRELHARGFVRAYRSKVTGRVVLERAHHDAVVRGQYGQQATPPAAPGQPRAALPPNRAGFQAKFGAKKRGA